MLITSTTIIIIPINLVNVNIASNGFTIINTPNIAINIEDTNNNPHLSANADFKLIANWNFGKTFILCLGGAIGSAADS